MDPAQFTNALLNAQRHEDPPNRAAAEKWLLDLEAQNPTMFLQLSAMELANNDKPALARQLGGLLLKNALSSKDDAQRLQKAQKWLQLDINLRNQIKAASLATLGSPVHEARESASQVVAEIARIELPVGQWNDLIGVLLNNMNSDNMKQATLQALGYICEEIDPEVLKTVSDQILTAVCKGIRDNNAEIKLAACYALYNALEFARQNFERETERNFLMQVACEGAIFPDHKIRTASLECIQKIAALYYDKLPAYMQKLFNITLETIKKANLTQGALKEEDEQPALQAIEFWSTIAEEEADRLAEAEEAAEMKTAPQRPSQNFIKGALKYLVPMLLESLTKQEDEPDEDAWNLAMAAGTCLALDATVVGDEIVPTVMPFVEQNINNTNWKFREAATLAFGAILEGPRSSLTQLIVLVMQVLLHHMKDPNEYVKDTTAWTIGRVCQLHPETILSQQTITPLVETLAQSLDDVPSVAAKSCWALHNIFEFYEDKSDDNTSILSPFFGPALQKLSMVAARDDANENQLRVSAYEAINTLISSGAEDTKQLTVQALPLFIDRFEKSFSAHPLSSDDRAEQNELQTSLCGVMTVITQKLGPAVKPLADRMMQMFLQVFNTKSAGVHEEAFLAIGAIANAVEGDFEKYMPHLRPYLIAGLKNYEEYQVCAVAVGVVGDVARCLGPKLVPYCEEIVTHLLQDLQNPHLNRSVKPPILSCFGDLALAIGAEFVKYLPIVMNMLQQASATSVKDTSDYDLVDYLNQLREGIFEAYTGIIQGLRSDHQADPILIPYTGHIVSFVNFVYADSTRSETVTRAAIGVLGDLGHALGSKVKQALQQRFVTQLITEGVQSEDPQTANVATWARDVMTRL